MKGRIVDLKEMKEILKVVVKNDTRRSILTECLLSEYIVIMDLQERINKPYAVIHKYLYGTGLQECYKVRDKNNRALEGGLLNREYPIIELRRQYGESRYFLTSEAAPILRDLLQKKVVA